MYTILKDLKRQICLTSKKYNSSVYLDGKTMLLIEVSHSNYEREWLKAETRSFQSPVK